MQPQKPNLIPWWDQFSLIHAKQRLAHALLLIGPKTANLLDFSYKIATAVMCFSEANPCGHCKSCRLLKDKQHPDIYHLQPEKVGDSIKIDQIRALQALAYTSPQFAKKRLIIIESAEKLNVSAANALLKILEEPPPCLMFILIAEHLSPLLPTIISRCQQWRINAENLDPDYLTQGESYSLESERGKIFAQHEIIIQDLINLLENKISVCELAQKLAAYNLADLIWLIYLINAQLLNFKLTQFHSKKNWAELIRKLADYFKPPLLYRQLDALHEIIRKLQQNSNLNPLLALENLLIGYWQRNN